MGQIADDKSSKKAKQLKKKVFSYLIRRNRKKYGAFLRFLQTFKYVSFNRARAEFLETYYVVMRYLDDIADGDMPIPTEGLSRVEYIERKVGFLDNLENPEDEIDYLLLYCFNLSNKFNQEFVEETRDILSSLLFDAKRLNTATVFPANVLKNHFHLMDIRGTIRATLKVFNEEPQQYILLEPLGIATRFQYDLEDFFDDVRMGLISISEEKLNQFGLRVEDLSDRENPLVKLWFREQALEGMKLLDQHRQNLKLAKFSFLTRITLYFVYEKPASKYFREVIQENENIDIPVLSEQVDEFS